MDRTRPAESSLTNSCKPVICGEASTKYSPSLAVSESRFTITGDHGRMENAVPAAGVFAVSENQPYNPPANAGYTEKSN
jgi:hypothetical protein